MRGLFVCFAIATILNVFFVLGRPPIDTKFATWVYPNDFSEKTISANAKPSRCGCWRIHEAIHPGRRRIFCISIAVTGFALLLAKTVKTALGLLFLTSMLAGATLFIRKTLAVSGGAHPALDPGLLAGPDHTHGLQYLPHLLHPVRRSDLHRPLHHLGLRRIPRSNTGRCSGWGYQSFWLVGPDAPSIVNAPGWVKDMPNGHNGYLDVKVELGYVGYALFLGFILTNLHAIGRVADRDMTRAWLRADAGASGHHHQRPRKRMDARLRNAVDRVPDPGRRNRPLLETASRRRSARK